MPCHIEMKMRCIYLLLSPPISSSNQRCVPCSHSVGAVYMRSHFDHINRIVYTFLAATKTHGWFVEAENPGTSGVQCGCFG